MQAENRKQDLTTWNKRANLYIFTFS